MSYIAAECQGRKMDFFTSLRNYGPQALAHVSGSTYRTRRHDFLRISNDKWCFIFKIRLVFFFIFRNKNHYTEHFSKQIYLRVKRGPLVAGLV